MKTIKKLSIMLLCFFMISIVAMPISASAAQLNKKSLSINVGKTYTLKVSGTTKKITWKSNKKSVATVSSKGVVTGVKKGTATITATYGTKKLACNITVKQPVTSIKLNKTSATIKKGKTLTLKATVSPSSANNKTVTWSSSNKKVATVSSKGIVKAVGKGTATITVKAKDGSGKKATCKITVTQPVTSIKLNKTSAIIEKGETLTLKATVLPSSANKKAVTWSSSNKEVATVSSKGIVKAVGKGTATITVKAKDGSGKQVTCEITVKNTVITTAEQLYEVLEHGEEGVTYTLGKDIDLSGYSKSASWFIGTLDGNGHKLLNLKQRLVDINSGTIKNIIFESCNITGKKTNLNVITAINADGTISNCTVKGKISFSEGGSAAAFADLNTGTIINCNNYATITGDGKYYDALGNEESRSVSIAGICYYNNGTITKCVNYGCLKGNSRTAGIAYDSDKTVENCLNVGAVNGGCGLVRTVSTGGVVKNCINVGKSSYGIAENVYGNVIDCYYLTSASEIGAPESKYVRMIAVGSNDLANTAAYPTLDFTNNWKMGTKYPIPRQ